MVNLFEMLECSYFMFCWDGINHHIKCSRPLSLLGFCLILYFVKQIVGRMSAEQRKVLLFFWTSVKYLPVEGFHGLASRLYIYKSLEPEDRLPSSHTCFFRLCFPPYSSMAVMQDRLAVITQEHIGCSFGTWWIHLLFV